MPAIQSMCDDNFVISLYLLFMLSHHNKNSPINIKQQIIYNHKDIEMPYHHNNNKFSFSFLRLCTPLLQLVQKGNENGGCLQSITGYILPHDQY